jgi:hypothetical protein
VFPGRYACPDPSALYHYLVEGVYHLLKDCYPKDQFATLFGTIFEEYVTNLIREFATDSPHLKRTFYPSPMFEKDEKGGRRNDQAGDGVILCGVDAILMEYKARVLTTRDRYSGDQAVTLKGIDDVLYQNKKGGRKGAAQLAHNIARVFRGEQMRAGSQDLPDLAGGVRIIPALVVYEEALATEAIRQEADTDFREALSKEGEDPTRVGPLLVLSVGDVEALAAVTQRHPLAQVLRAYLTHLHNEPKDRMGSFHRFVAGHARFSDLGNLQSWVGRVACQALEAARLEVEAKQREVQTVESESAA